MAIQLLRLSEYVQVFGLSGLTSAFEHYFKYKMGSKQQAKSTNIPGYGAIWMRPHTSDLATFREIFVNGEYDLQATGVSEVILRRYKALLAQGRRPIIIDAGANIGLATRYLIKHFPEARFILVEANSENASLARKNCEDFSNVTVMEAAIWIESGEISFQTSSEASTHRIAEHPDLVSDSTVLALKMNEIVGEDLDDLFMVKMDIEGAEIEVLKKENHWLEAMPIIMIEPHDGMMNRFGSLSGLLANSEYRDGYIRNHCSTLTILPKSMCQTM